MIHEAFPSLSETASGSHPCCVVSVTYLRTQSSCGDNRTPNPVWQIPTGQLSRDMIAAGLKARITCVDPSKVAKSFAGREYDLSLLNALPAGTDPCGENGEFHTFVYDALVFSCPIEVRNGEVVEHDGFVFADLLPV